MEIKRFDDQGILLKGKKESVLINPTKESLDSDKVPGRIVVFTGKDYDSLGISCGERVILRGPGEYEVGGIEVMGINAGEGDTVYIINVDGLVVGVLGDIAETLSDKKVERINAVDVLLVPVSGKGKIAGKTVLSWAKEWGVNYLMPVFGSTTQEEMKKFLDEVDREDLQPVESLRVDKENLPEGLEVIWIH